MMRKGLRISTGGVIRTSGGLQITVPPSAGSPPGESSALVSGAGTAEANGTYTPRGTSSGKPYYNLEGQPDDPLLSSVVWVSGSGSWIIQNSAGDGLYQAVESVDFPWEVAVWVSAGDGEEPMPTVTEA